MTKSRSKTQTRREMLTTAGAAAARVAQRRRPLPRGHRASAIPIPRSRSWIPPSTSTAWRSRTSSGSATGCRWCEGPVWFGDARCLLWSDIPNKRIMRWDEETGTVSVFRKPSNFANGNTRDRQGRLVTCEHGAPRHPHRIRRHHHGADRQVRRQAAQLAQRHRGEVGRLDLVHRSAVRHPRRLRGPCRDAGTADQRVPARPKTGQATVVAATIYRPNGLAFSPDESKLYVVERGRPRRARSSSTTWWMTAPSSPTSAC